MDSTHSASIGLDLVGHRGAATMNTDSTESTSWGWLVGLGAEYMITQNWTAFIEYNYIEFDKKNESFNLNTAPGFAANVDLKNTLSIAKVGVNYKF